MLIEPKSLYQSLQTHYYTHIPFPISPNTIQTAIEYFFKFLNEPDDIKAEINCKISPKHRRGDIGFKHRDPKDDIYNDSKDFFHFHPIIFEQYADFLEKNPVVNDFMLQAKHIWDLSYQTLDTVFKLFEIDYPGVYEKIFKSHHPHIILRFLKYHWQASDHYLAKPHFDAGSFTLAIAESGKGLRIGSASHNLKPVEHTPNSAIFMLSSNYQKIINAPQLLPAWHDVIQVDKTAIGKPFARWAMVVFVDGHDVEALPRSKTHNEQL